MTTEQKQIPIIGVGILVVDECDKVLLGSRIKLGEQHSWCFPSGKIDPHESFEQAAVRELFEETGLSVKEDQIKPFALMINKNISQINTTAGVLLKLDNPALKNQIVLRVC